MAGPVVLIVLGIVFLLGTMGVLHWSGLFHLFGRFWPVLIIIWGVIKLFEYQQAQREGVRAPGIGAGSIFLLIILVVFGLSATQASRMNWGALRDHIQIDDSDFPFMGQEFNFNDEMSQAFPGGASLKIVDDRGAVNVSASNDTQIKVTIRKRVGADDQATADKYNGQTKPQITVSGNLVTLNANTQGAGEHSVITDMDVAVPRGAAVSVVSRRGGVMISGRDANVDISNQNADVTVEDVKGSLTTNLEHSSLRAERIAGDVTVEGRLNDVSLIDIGGAAHLNGEFMESVKLSKVAKTVSFKSSRTDMDFTKLDGDLDLDSGDLHATSLAGPVHLTTSHKDIRLDGVAGDVRVDNRNGSVEVQFSSLGNAQIQMRNGDVQVGVPGKSGFQVDARSRNGEIQTDFPELNVQTQHDDATASGSVAGGGPRLVITNEHGAIEIRKGTAVATAPPIPPAPPAAKPPKSLPAPKGKPVQPTDN
jgi:hypothetical protein